MASLLTRFSIRARLLMMLGPLVVGLLYFAAQGVIERQHLANEMGNVVMFTDIAVAASNVMHHVQLERGMSAGFIASDGQDFRSQLPGQRQKTDEAIETLTQALGQQTALASNTRQGLDEALDGLSDRNRIRRDISALSMPLDEAIGYYTQANTRLASTISEMPRQSDNGVISTRLTAYASLIQAKERSGIERAVLATVFAADRFTAEQFQHWQSLVAEQETHLDTMQALMSEEDKGVYASTMSVAAVEASQRMRSLAQEKGLDGGFNIDPVNWFEQQTGRIEQLRALETHLAESLTEIASDMRRDAQQTLVAFGTLALILAIVSVGLAYGIGRSIVDPVRNALHALEDIAEGDGDLSRRLAVNGRDEIAQLSDAFNRFTGKIESMVRQIKEIVSSIHVASDQIAAGNDDLAQRTQEQASSLEETASSMEEMTATVRTTADNAREADQLAGGARDHAVSGGDVVAQAIEAMGQIQESSEQVTSIITVIEEIAFQTNLLALNAAVEAARAGDQGRGFAVVAGEVRILAKKSADAAREIRSLIDDSATRVQTGSDMVNASGRSLEEIVNAVKRVTDVVSEIAAASEEQSSGIQQVNSAVSQMDQVTQQNASLVEEVTAASRSLREQAQELNEMVSAFQVSDATQKEDGSATTLVQMNKRPEADTERHHGYESVA